MPTIKTCPICGKEFESRRGAKYCGDKCREIQNSRKNEECRMRQIKKAPLIKVCPICGKEFQKAENGRGLGSRVYCGDKCSRIAKRKLDIEGYTKRMHKRRTKQVKQGGESKVFQCAWCGKMMVEDEVYYADPAMANWFFCSRKCAIATMTEKFFAMKDAGIIVDKVDDLGIGSVNVVR